jgi:alpha-beta hydrolase superfamily lysophospholipase
VAGWGNLRNVSIWAKAREDILGPPFEALTLSLDADFEGPVQAALIRCGSKLGSRRAVLSLPGYNDYFFQRHVAEFFTARGINFYALDLRKYGRACQPHQTRHLCRSLSDYFPEINMAVDIIRATDENEWLLLSGHSTGGLIAALWLDGRSGERSAEGLFLNSPFLSSGVPWGAQAILNPALRLIADRRPRAAFPRRLSGRYSRSLHIDYGGEWAFNKEWKSTTGTSLRLGWLSAVHDGQRQVRAGLNIDVPVMVMCGARSCTRTATLEEMRNCDSVLNVESISKLATRLGSNVTCIRIKNAIHDVLLSPPAARDSAFAVLERWIAAFL